MTTHEHLVIFDGVCNFCNSSINFIIRNDKKNIFRFTPLQSATAAEILRTATIPPGYLESVIYVQKGKMYFKSTAVLKILRDLGSFYSIFYPLIIVPAFIRDFFYKLIANNRYKLFGKRESCMVPTAEMKNKFL